MPEPEARRSILTIYTDVRGLQRALEISSTETICVMLLDGEGEVVWKMSGPLDQHGADAIIRALVRLEVGAPAEDTE